MRRIEDDSLLRDLHDHGHGLIYNDFSGKSGGLENVLHAASCRWLQKSNTSVPKYFSPSLADAERWLQRNRGKEGTGWKRCGTCRAQVAEADASNQRAVPELADASIGHQPRLDFQQHASGRPYLVRTQLTKSGTVVEAWSSRRLPFEPKGWLLAFRNDLHKAVRQLKAGPNHFLQAVYASKQEGFFDVENVLFYNVGLSALKQAGQYGVHYERAYRAPAPPHAPSWPELHYRHYHLDTGSADFAHWQEGPVLARFQVATTETSDLTDCTRLWLLLKKQGKLESVRPAVGQPLILRVTIGSSAREPLVAIYLLKPLIDGIVAAFHAHDDQDIEEICRRLARRTESDVETLYRFLSEDTHAILGSRRLLWLYRRGVQWNPADEHCVAAEVHIHTTTAKQARTVVQGELRSTQYLGEAI